MKSQTPEERVALLQKRPDWFYQEEHAIDWYDEQAVIDAIAAILTTGHLVGDVEDMLWAFTQKAQDFGYSADRVRSFTRMACLDATWDA